MSVPPIRRSTTYRPSVSHAPGGLRTRWFRTLRCSAVLVLPVIGACLGASLGSGLGLTTAPAVARSMSPAPQPVAPAITWTGTSPEPEPHCVRVRRKFWQTGEGWIVRAVSICR